MLSSRRATPAGSRCASSATPTERPREARTIHFDFSFAELENLRLTALHSASNGAALSVHTDATRARFRAENVVGVNRQNHKMEILELPPQPVDANNAPQAVPFAVTKMGLGTRTGLLNAPVAVTVIDAGILILEDGNKRIQAVDVSGNPVNRFQNGTSIVQLAQDAGVVYLDLGVDGMGYMFVLSYVNDGMAVADYRLDIYDPQGNFLTRTTGVAAARMAVDTFRNVYTLNYEAIANAPRIEPSLSQWNPSTPAGCPTPPAA